MPLFGNGQLINHYTQHQEILSAYNPAFSGIENFTDFRFGVRKQWTGVEDAPVSTYFNVSSVIPDFDNSKKTRVRYKSPYDVDKLANDVQVPGNGLRMSNPELLRKMVHDSVANAVHRLDSRAKAQIRKQMKKTGMSFKFKQGVSLTALSDQQGAFLSFSGNLGYAVHLPLTTKWMMSSGVAINMLNTSVDKNKISVANPDDNLYNEVLAGQFNSTAALLNTGLLLYSADFYISYSIQRLVSRKIGTGNSYINRFTEMQHQALTGFKIHAGDITFVPSVLYSIKQHSPFNMQVNTRVYYMEKVWLGVNLRSNESLGGSFGLLFSDRYKFSYSYDSPFNRLTNNFQSTHEIIFGILLGGASTPNPIIR